MLKTNTLNITAILIFGCCFWPQSDLKAQLAPLFSQSIRSQELLNPAYNADKDYVSAIIMYRNQWYNINNSPNIMGVNIRFPLLFRPDRNLKGLGMGVNVLSETLGLRNTTDARITLDAYIRIMEHTFLGIGITGGAESFQYDITRLVLIEDPDIINNLTLKDVLPNMGFGLLLIHQNYRFGVSSLITARQDTGEDKRKLLPSANIYLRATYNLNKQIELMPAILLKYYHKFSPSIDVSTTLIFNEKLSGSIGYRVSESIFIGCGIKLNDLFWLSYIYDYPVKGISIFGTASHEVSLSFGMNKNHNKGNRLNEFK